MTVVSLSDLIPGGLVIANTSSGPNGIHLSYLNISIGKLNDLQVMRALCTYFNVRSSFVTISHLELSDGSASVSQGSKWAWCDAAL